MAVAADCSEGLHRRGVKRGDNEGEAPLPQQEGCSPSDCNREKQDDGQEVICSTSLYYQCLRKEELAQLDGSWRKVQKSLCNFMDNKLALDMDCIDLHLKVNLSFTRGPSFSTAFSLNVIVPHCLVGLKTPEFVRSFVYDTQQPAAKEL